MYNTYTMIVVSDIWAEALSILSGRLQAISFEVWIEKLEPLCFTQNRLILLANSQSSKKTIENKYLDTIKEAVTEVNALITDVIIITENQKEKYLKEKDYIFNNELVVSNKKPVKDNGFSFSKKYTFDTFVVGKSNEIAVAAAQTVAEHPGGNFNPLFLYGGVGLGKTHLMHAIGNYIKEHSPHLKILYTTAEKFTSDFINSINQNKVNKSATAEFKEKYRCVDVLMIDDIQFWSRSTGSQEAIFHIFNDLYQNDKHIIITSDRPPKEIAQLEERLRTRFEWGLTEEIKPPDLETRIAILKRKATGQNFFLTDDVAYFIAKNVQSNVRDMEGLLNKVIFYSSLTGSLVDSIQSAQEALRDYIQINKESIDANDIINTTARFYNVTPADIIGKRRTKEVVEPRMIAIYLIRDLLNIPLQSIGEIFGGRDHTTIINARDKIEDQLKSNSHVQNAVKDIKDMLYRR